MLLSVTSTFWLYRGFPPPSVPHSIAVRSPRGARQVPVITTTVQSITVQSPALGGYADPVFVVLPPPGMPVIPGRVIRSCTCCTDSPASPRSS